MAAELIQFPVSAQPVPETTGEQRKVSIENGYVRLANELVEKLSCIKLGGREFRLLCVVIRKTYGYGKKEDWISLSQMADMTNLDKANCSRLVDSLVKRQILTSRKRGHDRLLGINTQIDQWQEKKQRVVKNDNKVVKNDNKHCQKRQQNRENDNHNRHINNKDNLKDNVPAHVETMMVDQPIADQSTMVSQNRQQKTKTRKPVYRFTEADMAFALYMAQCIDAVNGTEEKRRNLKNWAEELRKMREIDGRNPEQIAAVFSWCNQDDFWQNNIQSPATLRKKFAMLNGKCLKASGKHFGMNNYENNGTAGQQHCSQQEYIDDISWLDR